MPILPILVMADGFALFKSEFGNVTANHRPIVFVLYDAVGGGKPTNSGQTLVRLPEKIEFAPLFSLQPTANMDEVARVSVVLDW